MTAVKSMGKHERMADPHDEKVFFFDRKKFDFFLHSCYNVAEYSGGVAGRSCFSVIRGRTYTGEM